MIAYELNISKLGMKILPTDGDELNSILKDFGIGLMKSVFKGAFDKKLLTSISQGVGYFIKKIE